MVACVSVGLIVVSTFVPVIILCISIFVCVRYKINRIDK